MYKKWWPALVFTLTVCLGLACGNDKERIVQEKVAERVNAFRVKKTLECREMLLLEAGVIVDSLLLNEALAAVNDYLTRTKPAKPVKPPAILPVDTAFVKPLFH